MGMVSHLDAGAEAPLDSLEGDLDRMSLSLGPKFGFLPAFVPRCPSGLVQGGWWLLRWA